MCHGFHIMIHRSESLLFVRPPATHTCFVQIVSQAQQIFFCHLDRRHSEWISWSSGRHHSLMSVFVLCTGRSLLWVGMRSCWILALWYFRQHLWKLEVRASSSWCIVVSWSFLTPRDILDSCYCWSLAWVEPFLCQSLTYVFVKRNSRYYAGHTWSFAFILTSLHIVESLQHGRGRPVSTDIRALVVFEHHNFVLSEPIFTLDEHSTLPSSAWKLLLFQLQRPSERSRQLRRNSSRSATTRRWKWPTALWASRQSRTMHVSRAHTPRESGHWTCHCNSGVSQHNSIDKIRLPSQNASRSMLHSARSSWAKQSDHIADGRHSGECSSDDDLSPQWLPVVLTHFRGHMMKWSSVSQKDHQYVVKRFVTTYIIVWRASCDSPLATGILSTWRWAWYYVPLHDDILIVCVFLQDDLNTTFNISRL